MRIWSLIFIVLRSSKYSQNHLKGNGVETVFSCMITIGVILTLMSIQSTTNVCFMYQILPNVISPFLVYNISSIVSRCLTKLMDQFYDRVRSWEISIFKKIFWWICNPTPLILGPTSMKTIDWKCHFTKIYFSRCDIFQLHLDYKYKNLNLLFFELGFKHNLRLHISKNITNRVTNGQICKKV